MGHANAPCFLSGISISYGRAAGFLLAKTLQNDYNNKLFSADYYYPINLPIFGKYSQDEFGFESIEESEATKNLVVYFLPAVRENKKKTFTIEVLWNAVRDAEEFKKLFNKEHPRTKEAQDLSPIYIDAQIFEWVVKNPTDGNKWKSIEEQIKNILYEVVLSKMPKKGSIFKNMSLSGDSLQEQKHPTFFNINKSSIENVVSESAKETVISDILYGIRDLLKLQSWMFNFGKSFAPTSVSHQDGENDWIYKFNKMVNTRIKKENEDT